MTNSDTAHGTYNKITKIYSQYRLYHTNKAGEKIISTGGSWHDGIVMKYIRVAAADDDTPVHEGTGGVLKRFNQPVVKEVVPNDFADVAAAKAKLLSANGLAVWEDNATNIQWALDGDNHKLKVTADFGIPTNAATKPWAQKFAEEYAALATPEKVNDTGLFNKACDATTWGDTKTEHDQDDGSSSDPSGSTIVDAKATNPDEYNGGSQAPDGNDGKMSMVWEEDSEDHLF